MISFDKSDPSSTTQTSPYSDFGDFLVDEKFLIPKQNKSLNQERNNLLQDQEEHV